MGCIVGNGIMREARRREHELLELKLVPPDTKENLSIIQQKEREISDLIYEAYQNFI